MGATISSFGIFSELAKYGKKAWPYKRLKRFKLYCFILHSPKKHKDFHKYVGDNFLRLDFISRGNIIFFTIVKPNKEFLYLVEKQKVNRQYIKELESIEKGNGIGDNAEASVYSLCKDLGIPESVLPCIVVTNDFVGRNVFWLNTNERTINEDLEELNYKAQISSDENIISAIRANSKFKPIAFAQKNFAQILFEALSLNVSSANIHPDSNTLATNTAKQKIKSLIEEVKAIKLQTLISNKTMNDYPDIEYNKILLDYEDMMTKILSQLLVNFEISGLVSGLDRYKNFLEQDSFDFLVSGSKVLTLFKDESDFDFSSAILPYAKVIENEINHSIIQWLRKRLNINFPTYFYKYQPDFRGDAYINGKNLNDTDRNGNWKPLPLGDAMFATNSFMRTNRHNTTILDEISVYLDNRQFRDFYNISDDIRKLRNMACHRENLTIEYGFRIKEEMQQLYDQQYIQKLHQIKENLRGR